MRLPRKQAQGTAMRVRSEHSERNLFFSRRTLTVSLARLLSSVIGTATIFDALLPPTARHPQHAFGHSTRLLTSQHPALFLLESPPSLPSHRHAVRIHRYRYFACAFGRPNPATPSIGQPTTSVFAQPSVSTTPAFNYPLFSPKVHSSGVLSVSSPLLKSSRPS